MEFEEKPSQREKSAARQAFIIKLLKEGKLVTFADLVEESNRRKSLGKGGGSSGPLSLSFPVSSQSIKNDIEKIRQREKLDVRKKSDGGRITIYNAGLKTLTDREKRRLCAQEAKLAIAYVLGGLILAQSERSPGRPSVPEISPTINRINGELVSPGWIIERIKSWANLPDQHPWHRKSIKVTQDLEHYWATTSRRIAIDSGSTIDKFAQEVLAHTFFKTTDDIISSFEVCTNSRFVFNLLGEPSVNIRTMIFGGIQEEGSEAVCGHLTESFLDSCGLHFPISVVGATIVDCGKHLLGSDHFRDGVIKQKLLDMSQLRIVVADSSKFSFTPMAKYNSFCPINPKCIDLIITDSYSEIAKNLQIPFDPATAAENLSQISSVPILEAGPEVLQKIFSSAVSSD